jgi:hypothetical protein
VRSSGTGVRDGPFLRGPMGVVVTKPLILLVSDRQPVLSTLPRTLIAVLALTTRSWRSAQPKREWKRWWTL